jgi:phospholipase/lecithinase/hemolysin
MRKLAFFVFSLVFIFVRLPSAYALDLSKFEHWVFLGDSLSDTGNSLYLSRMFPIPQPQTPPYGNTYDSLGNLTANPLPGRWTDGKNWVDYLPDVAATLGGHFPPVTAFFPDPLNENATNFAIGGATSGDVNVAIGPPYGFQTQISAYVTSLNGKSAANDLCVIWIGANDFAAGLATGNINPRATVENIRSGIALLSSVGARTFIVINLPDIALTPQIKAAPTIIQAARQFVFTVNILLEVELVPFAWRQGITVEIVDINRLFVPLVLNPVRFGFTNSSGFALDPGTGGGDTNPNDYVFWDGFHPTTNAYHFAAEFIYKEIASRRAFPEILRVPLARLHLR